MNRIATLSLCIALCSGAGAAHAAGLRTLKTIVKAGHATESAPAMGLRIRAPLGTRIQQDDGGMLMSFSPVEPVKRTNRSAIFQLPPNRYFLPQSNQGFTIKPAPAIGWKSKI